MHHDNEVRVFTAGPQGHGESPAGVGWLVTPSVVVMRQSGRGATPGLPSHIGIPAVSGGGRDDSIPVLGVYESPELDGWVALQLDRECDLSTSGAVPEGLDLSVLSTSDTTPSTLGDEPVLLGGSGTVLVTDDGTASTDGWLCRAFPYLPGCRT